MLAMLGMPNTTSDNLLSCSQIQDFPLRLFFQSHPVRKLRSAVCCDACARGGHSDLMTLCVFGWQVLKRIPIGSIPMVKRSFCLQVNECLCPKKFWWTMQPVLRDACEYKYEGVPGELVRAFVCKRCR